MAIWYRFTHRNILVLSSPDEEKGVLLELARRGCRELECYLRGIAAVGMSLCATGVPSRLRIQAY